MTIGLLLSTTAIPVAAAAPGPEPSADLEAAATDLDEEEELPSRIRRLVQLLLGTACDSMTLPGKNICRVAAAAGAGHSLNAAPADPEQVVQLSYLVREFLAALVMLLRCEPLAAKQYRQQLKDCQALWELQDIISQVNA